MLPVGCYWLSCDVFAVAVCCVVFVVAVCCLVLLYDVIRCMLVCVGCCVLLRVVY